MEATRAHLSLVAGPPGAGASPRRGHGVGRRASARRPLPATPSQGAVRARVAAITDHCWQCRSKVRAIVGVLVDPALTADGSGFLPLDDVAEPLAAALDRRTLAARRIGPLRHRESPGVRGGYIANGCVECDALLGRFALEDLLAEHIVNGGTHAQLDIGIVVELPGEQTRLRASG
jgi:hypothetical protein